MLLLPWFKWFQDTSIGSAIRTSTYWFPFIEVVHLLGLVVLLGPILLVDLRLLGFGRSRLPVPRVVRAVAPLLLAGIATMLATGLLLLSAEAIKCYDNPAFWFKMYFLAGALLFHSTIYFPVAFSTPPGRAISKITGAVSLILWFGVALGGRVIAFL